MTVDNDALKRIRRQRRIYRALLEAAGLPGSRTAIEPMEARRAIVALSGVSHADLARMIGGSTAGTTRQLVSMIVDGRGRSDRVERALAAIYGLPHKAMFPEPRSRRPSKASAQA